MFFSEGEEETIGRVGGKVGEGELGELLDGAEFSGFIAGDGGFGRGLDEGECVWAVADGGAGDEPSVAVFEFEGLEEKLDDASVGGFFGDFEMEGWFVGCGVFLNR